MPQSPVGIRTAYLLDGAGSRTISDGLRPVLAEVRVLLGASVGLIAYRPRAAGAELLLLAADAPDMADPLLPNETVQASIPMPVLRPTTVRDLLVWSTLRAHRVVLRSAVVVPWSDQQGDGVVIVGQAGAVPALPRPAAEVVRLFSSAVRRAVAAGRRQGATEINLGLQRAMKDVAASAVDSEDVADVLTTLLITARQLFGSEVAYLALPEHDVETFTFDQMLGIRTPGFRHLRIQEGQGLGGLARSMRRPVRSLNYARDARLHAAPVVETAAEGIISAMATPILVDEQVQAVLYVGDRTLRPFTETDEEVLGEFAEYATLGLKRRATEAYRRDVLRRQEQERLAFDLHDTAMRGLLEIGFAAERGQSAPGMSKVQASLASIAAAAERCMDALRGQLDLLLEGTSGRTARAVLDEIAGASIAPDIDHRFVVRGPDTVLPDAVADALIRIGQEALVNTDRHAAGVPADVELGATADAWVLTVANTTDGGADAAHDDGGHVGLRAMQIAAARVHGRVERMTSADRSFIVRATVPILDGR